MSTNGFSDLDAEKSAVLRNLVKDQLSPGNNCHGFIFSCKSASAPRELSANAKTLRRTLFADSKVPRRVFFTMSSDSKVPQNGRVIGNWWNACRPSLFCLYLDTKLSPRKKMERIPKVFKNVFKLNTPWIQDSRFKVQGKVFSRMLNLESKPLSK